MTKQYKCPSYYDDDGVLRDCTCGKCSKEYDQLQQENEKLRECLRVFISSLAEDGEARISIKHNDCPDTISLSLQNFFDALSQAKKLLGEE